MSAPRCDLLWLALPIMALWVNLHGAFPAGLMLLGCALAGEVCRGWSEGSLLGNRRLRLLALVLAGGFLATLLNPYGWRVYQYVRLTSNIAATRRIDEWLPPALDQGIGVAWLASMVVLAVLLFAAWKWRGLRPRVEELWLIGLFLPLACGSARMVAWWLIVIAPMIAQRVTLLWPPQPAEEKPTAGAALSFALLSLVAIFSLPGLQHLNPLLAWRSQARTEHDLDQVRSYLDRQTGDTRVFCRFEWGEYLSWACYPRHKVFMDGRIEIYPDEVWAAYSDVTRGKDGWCEVLDRYRVETLVLDEEYHARTGLLERVKQSTQWSRTFTAGPAIVFQRSSAHVTLTRALTTRV